MARCRRDADTPGRHCTPQCAVTDFPQILIPTPESRVKEPTAFTRLSRKTKSRVGCVECICVLSDLTAGACRLLTCGHMRLALGLGHRRPIVCSDLMSCPWSCHARVHAFEILLCYLLLLLLLPRLRPMASDFAAPLANGEGANVESAANSELFGSSDG